MQEQFKKQLSRYKGSFAFPLEYLIPVDHFNDDGFWQCLIDDISSIGSGWEFVQGVVCDSHVLIPDDKGIYLFIWTPDSEIKTNTSSINFNSVVYIGSSVTPEVGMKSRFTGEYSKILGKYVDVHWTKKDLLNRSDRIKKVLNLGRLTFAFNVMKFGSKEQILDVEKRLVRYFNPPGNKVGTIIRARRDKEATSPAFKEG